MKLCLQESPEDNPVLTPIINAVENAIESEDKKANVEDDFDLSKLLPGIIRLRRHFFGNFQMKKKKSKPVLKILLHIFFSISDKHSYYTYDGSLTTAPFAECVTWTILHHRVTMSNRQLNVLRRITKHNARSLQALHDRQVRSSFHVVRKNKN